MIRTLNNEIRRNKTLEEKLFKTFDRNYVLSGEQMKSLDEISPYFIPIKHKKGEVPDRKTSLKIISSLQGLAKSLKGIYPTVIRITREVTDEYGTQYFEAVDDEKNEWTIKYGWLDPDKPYFMYSKTNPVAVNPIIIEKIS